MDFGLKVKKWVRHPSEATYAEPALSLLVPLKITFEFVALLVGRSIYEPLFDTFRSALQNGDESFAARSVALLHAGKPRAFHGICFHGNEPSATFSVRLFGSVNYRVKLLGIQLNMPECTYTHDLETGEETFP